MEKEQIDINELKNLFMQYGSIAFSESFDKGKRKYGDRWKTTDWSGVKALADSKWDMFVNILDTGSHAEIAHHASDMMAWITILSARAIWDMKQDDKRETVVFNAADKYPDLIEGGYNQGELVSDVVAALQSGKRVVIE